MGSEAVASCLPGFALVGCECYSEDEGACGGAFLTADGACGVKLPQKKGFLDVLKQSVMPRNGIFAQARDVPEMRLRCSPRCSPRCTR